MADSPRLKMLLTGGQFGLGTGFFSCFIMSAQTPGTQCEFFGLAVHNEGSRVNIWHEHPVCMSLGVAHITTKLGCFAAKITLQQYVSP